MQSRPPVALPRPAHVLAALAPLLLFAGLVAAHARSSTPVFEPMSADALHDFTSAGDGVLLHSVAVEAPRSRAAGFTPTVPTVSIVDLNSGPHVDRAQCVVASAGAGAAFECGDLRLVHGAPGVRVRGKNRAPVLLYNSKYAHPRQTVYADVSLPAGASVPDSVIVAMTMPNGALLSRRAYRGSDWIPGGIARRVAAQWDATGTGGTRIAGYAWQVSTLYAGTMYSTPLLHAPFAIVDRRQSPFGAGWWVAGLEQLVWVSGGIRILWVGGDGSTRLYKNVAPGAYTVDSISRPDTLKSTTVGTETHYFRTLPGGAQIWFNSLGQHYKTVSRLGETTTFAYSSGRLSTITYPGTTLSHTFGYDGAGRLSTVSAPGPGTTPRIATWSYGHGDGRVTGIQDPDGHSVLYGYASGSTSAVVTSRTGRRETAILFGFDNAWKLTSVKTPLAPGDTLTSRFYATEFRGLTGSAPLDHCYTFFDGPRTDVQDFTSIWLTAWGAPQRIRNAMGHETVLTRADPRFRALVTQVVAANGLMTRAWYNARGNVDSTSVVNGLGDGRDAVTRYAYDAVWRDFITRITAPEGETTAIGYDPLTGNRAWQQTGPDASKQVTFQYYGAAAEPGSLPGYIRSATLPLVNGQTAVERYEYDGLGNLRATVTPQGFRTAVHNDAIGRTWRTEAPIEGGLVQVEENTFYPNTDLVELRRSIGPALNGVPQQTMVVRTQYDPGGNPRIVERWSEPEADATRPIGRVTTEYRYDALGRKVVEIAPDGQVDSTWYDPSGNAVRLRTRRHAELVAANLPGAAYITMEYDALNRLTVRRTPAVRYAERREGFGTRFYFRSNSEEVKYYPRYANDGGTGYRIAGDTARFEYDIMGNLVKAENADALVHRRYYPNGLTATDSLYVRTVAGTAFDQHKYGLEYLYDRNGRRTEMRHPQQLAPSASQNRQTYGYTPQGTLEWTTDLLGNFFRYGFNVRGEMETQQLAGGSMEQYGYDPDGNMTLHSVTNGTSGSLRSATLGYDNRGKLKSTRNQYGTRDTLTATYSGLGHVVNTSMTSWAQNGQAFGCVATSVRSVSGERLYHDALGNLYRTDNSHSMSARCGESWSNTSPSQLLRYEAGTGRLASSEAPSSVPMRDSTWYDAAGNAVFTANPRAAWVQNGALSERASYFAADGTLRAADARSIVIVNEFGTEYRMAFEEYRYDALGRRVWVRARRYCENLPNNGYAECNIDKVRRTVWDGGHELWEIQMPGGEGSPHMENDVAQLPALPLQPAVGSGWPADPLPFFGRVAFAHGIGTDRPLSLVRIGYGDQLNQSTNPAETNTQAVPRWLAPFAIIPLWNSRGQADLGTFTDGTQRKCELDAQGKTRCIYLGWPGWWPAYQRPRFGITFWHGTLIEDKRDDAGTFFRRNRYYDPASGRFTQEDPIGLAGGANAYGFAAGDPVNFGDPYGLKVCVRDRRLRQAVTDAFNADIIWVNGCISEIRAHGGDEWHTLQGGLRELVASPSMFRVGWTYWSPLRSRARRDRHGDWNALINERQSREEYSIDRDPGGCGLGDTPWTIEALVVHELAGHLLGVARNGQMFDQTTAIDWENHYNAARGRPLRSQQCGR